MFAQKLSRHIQKKFGSKLNLKQQAEACGVGDEHFRQFMNGQSNPPSDDKIVEIAGRLQLSEEETKELLILAASDRAKSPETKGILSRVLGPDFFKRYQPIELKEDHKIPVYSTIKAGAGEMGVEGEIVDEISIDDDYRRQKVFAVRVSGNSMEPEIFDGEIAIFKPINGEPRKDRDIFAVEVEGWASWVIKFVREDASGMIQLISANQTYQVKEIDPKVNRVILRGPLLDASEHIKQFFGCYLLNGSVAKSGQNIFFE